MTTSTSISDAAKLINETVDPRQFVEATSGGRFICPVCGEHHTPSMEYNPDKNRLNCFGCDPDEGQKVKIYSTIDIYMKAHRVEFMQAVEELAPLAGIQQLARNAGGDPMAGRYDLHNLTLPERGQSAQVGSVADTSGKPAAGVAATSGKPAAPADQKPQVNAVSTAPDDFTFPVLMDPVKYPSKPETIAEVRGRELQTTQNPERLTPVQFAQEVTQGRTFYPCVFKKTQNGTRKDGKPNYEYIPQEQQIFVVDIDNEKLIDGKNPETGKPKKVAVRVDDPITPKDALEVCKKNNVQPFLLYETFSSKKHRDDTEKPYYKFRLCFVLDKPLQAYKVGETGLQSVTRYFVSMFGDTADSKVTDTARMIFGTDEKDRAHLFGSVLKAGEVLKRAYSGKPAAIWGETETAPDTGERDIDEFFDIVQTRQYEAQPTGIYALDNRLAGGFVNEWLVGILSYPGAGKTALATQIAENIAQQGRDMLYFNFEMTKPQLIARSLARYINKPEISALKIMRMYGMTADEKAEVYKAGVWYKKALAPHMLYNPDHTGPDLQAVAEVMEKRAQIAEAAGDPAPVVCIDYLQMIKVYDQKHREKDPREAVKDAVYTFKTYAEKHHAVVICISAQSRSANNDAEARQDAGRDSSNIEYSMDLQLQIKNDPDDPTMRRLYVTKSRFAEPSLMRYQLYKFLGAQGRFLYDHDGTDAKGREAGDGKYKKRGKRA